MTGFKLSAISKMTATAKERDPVADLNLGVIGNCSFNALINRKACVVWSCMPRPDSEPVFNALLSGRDPSADDAQGVFDVQIEDFAASEQFYEENTPVLVTHLKDKAGQIIEVIDF